MSIAGYVFPPSGIPGGEIGVFLRGTEGTATLTAERVGRSEVLNAQTLDVPSEGSDPRYDGCDWRRQSFQLVKSGGGNPSSGLYVLRANGADLALFVVRPRARAARFMALMPFATRQAYNDAGGGSFYVSGPDGSVPRQNRISSLRPMTTTVGAICGGFIGWFEGAYPSELLDYCTSLDLHEDPALLDGYTVLFILGHDEYWSSEMLAAVERFTLGGGNVVCLSGNTAYGRVRFDDQRIGDAVYRSALMSFFIPSTRDSKLEGIAPLPPAEYAAQLQSYLRSPTGTFPDPPTSHPQNRALGVGFESGFWGISEITQRYSCNIPNPNQHWAFAGVDFTQGAQFGNHLFVYETDAAAVEKGPNGLWYVTGEDGTPKNFTVLAVADLRGKGANKPGLATLGYFTRNGTVFTAATTEWVQELGDPSGDPRVRTITKNVVDRLGNMSAPAQRWNTWDVWEEIDEAYFVRGMAASGGMLFVTTAEGKLWRRPPVAARIGWWLTGEDVPPTTRALTATSGALHTVRDMDGPYLTRYGFGFGERSWTPLDASKPARRVGGVTGETLTIKHLASVARTLFAVASVKSPSGEEVKQLLWSSADDGIDWFPAKYFSMAGPSGQDVNIVAMTAAGDHLFAATSEGRLLRTPTRFVTDGGGGWEDIGHAFRVVALAAIEGMLYVLSQSTDDVNRYVLWRRDLHHFTIDPAYRK